MFWWCETELCELFDTNRCGHLKENVICLQAMSFDVAAAAAIIVIFFFWISLREKKNTEWNNIENVQT